MSATWSQSREDTAQLDAPQGDPEVRGVELRALGESLMRRRESYYRRWVTLVSVILLAACASLASAQTAREVAQRAFRSVVLLVMEDDNGQPVSLGSGFFVGQNTVATNLHVIEGSSRGYAKLVGTQTKLDIEGTLGVDRIRDLALLKLSGGTVPALEFGHSDNVAVGDSIYAVGNPQGLEGTFSQGIVSGIRTIGNDTLLQITAPISPGSSGGPVLSTVGGVIGVAVATFRGGQNLNFAIPSSYVKALHDRKGSLEPLRKSARPTDQKSIIASLGGRSTEGVVGRQLQWSWKWHGPLAGGYSFSLHNQLREAVRDIYCLVVFYDRSGTPIEVEPVRLRDVIPPGLARRVTGKVHQSVQELTTPDNSQTPTTRIELRILDFRIAQ